MSFHHRLVDTLRAVLTRFNITSQRMEPIDEEETLSSWEVVNSYFDGELLQPQPMHPRLEQIGEEPAGEISRPDTPAPSLYPQVRPQLPPREDSRMLLSNGSVWASLLHRHTRRARPMNDSARRRWLITHRPPYSNQRGPSWRNVFNGMPSRIPRLRRSSTGNFRQAEDVSPPPTSTLPGPPVPPPSRQFHGAERRPVPPFRMHPLAPREPRPATTFRRWSHEGVPIHLLDRLIKARSELQKINAFSHSWSEFVFLADRIIGSWTPGPAKYELWTILRYGQMGKIDQDNLLKMYGTINTELNGEVHQFAKAKEFVETFHRFEALRDECTRLLEEYEGECRRGRPVLDENSEKQLPAQSFMTWP